MRFRVVFFAAALLLSLSTVTYANSIGVDFTGGFAYSDVAINQLQYGWTNGYEFNVLSPINLVGLAAWFQTPVGAAPEEHAVGVWDNAGNLLASAVVTAADAQMGAAGFYYIPITPVLLPVGLGYQVGAQSGLTDLYVFDGSAYAGPDAAFTSFVVAPEIEFVGDVFAVSNGSGVGGLTYPGPGSTTGIQGYFGGNIVFEAGGEAPIPEPTSLLLLGSGIGFLALSVWRKNK